MTRHVTRTRIAVLFGLLISVVFLILAFQGLHPEAVLASLGAANVPLLIVAAVIFFPRVLVATWRWQFLLDVVGRVPMGALFRLVCIGYMGNNVYPLRAGEALRVYLLKRNHDLPVTPSLMTIVVERVFDGIVMLTFIVLSLLLVDVQSDEIRTVASVAAPIFIGSIAAFVLLAMIPQWTQRLVERVTSFLPDAIGGAINGFAADILGVLAGLRSPAQLIGALVTSYLSWAFEAFIYWMVMWAFGLDLGYPVALLLVSTVNLAGLIPASPGQVGVYEFFASAVMMAVGVPQDTAVAFALTVHVVIWLPVTVAGFVFLVRQGMGWQSITRARELEASAAK